MSSTVSHRERVLRFQARQLLMERLRRSVTQIDNERRSPAQGVAELPRQTSTPREACLVLIGPAIECVRCTPRIRARLLCVRGILLSSLRS